ncbi:rhomboid family intramembrane serine protease, partial [Bifidobacterium longum]
MSNGRFSLFPGAPSAHNLFSKRAIQYQWRSNGPVFTSAIIIACVAVWVVEMVFSLFWPLGLATMIYYGRFDPMTAVAQPWMFLTSMFLHSPKSVLHILFNMLALWSVGPVLEKMMGHWPFLALY